MTDSVQPGQGMRTPLLVPLRGNQGKPMHDCPYCGRPIRTRDKACEWCDDLRVADEASR